MHKIKTDNKKKIISPSKATKSEFYKLKIKLIKEILSNNICFLSFIKYIIM
jgi:hypothetical protein